MTISFKVPKGYFGGEDIWGRRVINDLTQMWTLCATLPTWQAQYVLTLIDHRTLKAARKDQQQGGQQPCGVQLCLLFIQYPLIDPQKYKWVLLYFVPYRKDSAYKKIHKLLNKHKRASQNLCLSVLLACVEGLEAHREIDGYRTLCLTELRAENIDVHQVTLWGSALDTNAV